MDENIKNIPQHIAIIMDGNRRWAKEHKVSVSEGHKMGAETLEKVADYCNKIGIKYLTVYAFSTENWKRSTEEVGALMSLLKTYVTKFSKKAYEENMVIKVLGDINVLEKGLKNSIEKAEELTKNDTGLTVNIALNYGGRSEIVMAMKKIGKDIENGILNPDDINEEMIDKNLYTANQPDPDLLIRTSGELRISNFLPWQIVYSEFLFEEKYWPDFNNEDIDKAIEVYQKRNRKFGGK